MGKREELCLRMRNNDGQEKEEFCLHFIKSKKGYMRFLFCRLETTAVFIMCAIFSVVGIFTVNEGFMTRLINYLLAGIPGFFWLCFIYKGLWYWKYSRHVFVTDAGIWIMTCSSFWWRGAPDFMGKRRLLAPSWSLYTWSELKSVSLEKPKIEDTDRITPVFEAFDDMVKKSSKYKTVYLTRFDGTECVDFLKNADADALMEYAGTRKRSRKKKKAEQEE